MFPTVWDHRQLDRCREAWAGDYTILFDGPADHDCDWDFDVVRYLDVATAEFGKGKGNGNRQIAGVTSSSDYPGATVAAALATRLGLSGSRPEAILRCSHKFYSRIVQRDAVPEATPPFWLIDPRFPDGGIAARGEAIEFPCYIKPVKGAFSVMARALATGDELREFLARPAVQEFSREYVAMFNALVAALSDFEINGSHFLAEGFLRGQQVTVEGYVFEGEVHTLGVVDSILHPGIPSFARFDYPSVLPEVTQARMRDLAARVIARLGLQNTMFNIEMIHEPAGDTVHIIEINPRLCGQFADLYRKVDGTSGYEIALALATGRRPDVQRGQGRFPWATSFPLRVFEPCEVVAAPDAERIAEVEARHPGVLVWSECEVGQRLDDFERFEDGYSARYAIVNLGADSRGALLDLRAEVESELGFAFRSIATHP